MKTGRTRRKSQPAAEEKKAAEQPTAQPATTGSPAQPAAPRPVVSRASAALAKATGKKGGPPVLIFGILLALFVCFVLVAVILTLRGGADEWVKATRANGAWTTTVTVFGPQAKVEERWETDCTSDPNGAVRAGTCVLKDTNTHHDSAVDDYDEYAYDIYYEETWDKTYQAQGTEFVVTTLGSDDWWEGNRHYTQQEELDKASCNYTNYTVWVDDPQDKTQEIEVYLSECEVWDHVVVEERVYDQKSWCQCDVTTLVQIGQSTDQGTGLDVRWPNPNVPAGGRSERSFKGQVTFVGGDNSYTTTTDDLARYQDYLMSQYYIGLRDGKPVTVSTSPKE
jgi:hypothetical protein